MYPSKNGVRSAASYYVRDDRRAVDLLPDYCFSHVLVQFGFVREELNVSTAWRARPFWSIVAASGLTVGVVRWPLTYPAEPVAGFLVSDRFHQLVGSISEFDRAAFPAEILPVLEAAFAEPPPVADTQLTGAGAGAPTSPETSAMLRDQLYSRVMHELAAQMDPRVIALRYDGLDVVGHSYLRYTRPRTFRDVPEEERRRFSQVLDRYYAFIDSEIAAAADNLAPGDLLMVVSGFGMQPLNPIKQAVARLLGDPDFSGTHEQAPDGFLLAYGSAAEPGRRERGSIVDVAPTLLYFLGLPVARDMDGYARADLFTRAFKAERPIVFIRSYSR
jgi:predicted AlkP superfamily phosphohydrolase/phosphomutase